MIHTKGSNSFFPFARMHLHSTLKVHHWLHTIYVKLVFLLRLMFRIFANSIEYIKTKVNVLWIENNSILCETFANQIGSEEKKQNQRQQNH